MQINKCLSLTCLEQGLVSLRSACSNNDCSFFYLEDLEGIDATFLANTARLSQVSAEIYAKQLISTAARLMLADIQMLMTSGYSLVESFGELCSTCNFTNSVTNGGGVVVTNVTGSKFAVLRIMRVNISCNAAQGTTQNLVFDDGVEIKVVSFVAQGPNVNTPVLVSYETTEKAVKVYLQNASIGVATVLCEKTSGCGCSGSTAAPANTAVVYSGLLQGMNATQQYGFKICAAVTCSTDILVCSMVKQTPQLFAATLMYKAGALAFANSTLSTRNNRDAGFDENKKETMAEYYESIYQQRLVGDSRVKGLKLAIIDYLRRNKDLCLTCYNPFGISYAAG